MIRMQDFTAEPLVLRDEMLGAIERVMTSGVYVLGREVREFESAFAARCNARFAVGVGNGLDAIELALRAAGVGPGDEVIAPAMSAFASILGIMRAGAVPVLADIDPATALLSIESAKRCIGPRTRAILLVHLYGNASDPASWQELCALHGIDLVEDCAQAVDARWAGRSVGTFGRTAAFSFYPTKNLGAIGDAGAVLTDDDAVADRIMSLRHYGQTAQYVHAEPGMNSRLDELQAAILMVRMAYLSQWTNARRQIAMRYAAGIRHPLVTLPTSTPDHAASVHHLFVIRSPARAALQTWLWEQGIETAIHYPLALHRQQAALGLRTDPAGLYESERHAHECLSLPCHPFLSAGDADRVIEAINSFAAER